MELRRLRYFVVLAEELHFGHAARRLHMAQPPLSQQIRRLEEELGVRLFERGHHHVELTHSGLQFLHQARVVLEQAERAVAVAQRADRGELGVVEVGFTGSLPYSDMFASLLRDFSRRYPEVRLQLRELSSRVQLTQLIEGRLDVGLLRPAPMDSADDLETWTVAADRYLVALPSQHRLARQPSLTLAQLRDDPFILYSRSLGSSTSEQILGLCMTAGFSPRVAQEVLEMPTLVGLVAAGIGVGLVAEPLSRLRMPGVVFRPLSDVQATLELRLCARRGRRSPAAEQFIASVLETSGRTSPVPPPALQSAATQTWVKRPGSAARQSAASSEPSSPSSSSPGLRKR